MSYIFIHEVPQSLSPAVTVGKHLTLNSNRGEDEQKQDLIVIHLENEV